MSDEGPPMSEERTSAERDRIQAFYDEVYHRRPPERLVVGGHLRRLARRLGVGPGDAVLDVACGTGEWLAACAETGASVAGIDLSERAVEAARRHLPGAELRCGPAETLPFESGRFGLVTCLGSLEHFLEPVAALREMLRVATPDARLLLLVPNSGFLTRRLGLYGGTQQARVREEVRSLEEWAGLFEDAGLVVEERWRDLHVLSWRWIRAGRGWRDVPLRAAQALALAFWPLRWQYQVHHLCRRC